MKFYYSLYISVHSRIRQVEGEMPVAFFSFLSSHATHLGTNQNIAFDHVTTNVGNAYNSHIGAFIVPADGIYLFSATLRDLDHTNKHFDFALNGKIVAYMSSMGENSPSSSVSQTIVLSLKKGDGVAVRNRNADHGVNAIYSSFTGVLIHQENLSAGSVLVGK